MIRQTLLAEVFDTNHQARGAMEIQAEFDETGPTFVQHGGRAYWYTGKGGSDIATGKPAREMATEKDARLWLAMDGSAIWED